MGIHFGVKLRNGQIEAGDSGHGSAAARISQYCFLTTLLGFSPFPSCLDSKQKEVKMTAEGISLFSLKNNAASGSSIQLNI